MSDTNKTGTAGKVAENLQAVGDAARQTGQQARQAGADAVHQARDVAQEAKSRAASTLGSLGEQASAVADDQKAGIADRMEDVAKAVHKSGEQLEGHQDWVAKLVEQGADELSSLANTLRSNDLQSLLGDLGSLARRQPALFVGASMAAGFALTRIGRLAVSGAPAPATAPSEQNPAPAASTSSAAMTSAGRPSGTGPGSARTGAVEVDRERR